MGLSDRIIVQTPESVELEFTLAGVGSRCLALLVDYALWSLSLLGFMYLWIVSAERIRDLAQRLTGNGDNGELWLLALFFLIFFALYVGYFVVFETLWQGQTPGKRWAKIRVICNDGRPAGLSQAILRAILRPFDDWMFIGFLLLALTPQEQRLGDWLAGTLVVQAPRPWQPLRFKPSPEAIDLMDYLVRQGQWDRVLPQDFSILRDYLQRRPSLLPAAQAHLSQTLAQDLQHLLRLPPLGPSVAPQIFLEAMYLAYQHLDPHDRP